MTRHDIFNPLNIALAALLAATTIAGFSLVPDGTMLPTHWGPNGEADAFMPRNMALLVLPGIAAALVVVLVAVQKLSSPERREASRHVIAPTVAALLALFTTIQAATVLIGMGLEVNMVRIVVLGLGLLFVVLGNFVPKTQPNRIAGFRMPWTLNDPANWQATNRLGGMLMMAGGAAIALVALLTGQPEVLLVVTLLGVAVPLVITTLYSLRRARG